MGTLAYYLRTIIILSLLLLVKPTTSATLLQEPLCHSAEQSALWQFKESFIIDRRASAADRNAYPKVASWDRGGETSDCCSWDGVECDTRTGHVIGLDLSSSCLFGSINSTSSLFQLVHLQKLNLAFNDFNYSAVPSNLGNLSMLTHLNLSYSLFSGQIPSELSILDKLTSLDLSYNYDLHYTNLLELQRPNLRSLIQNLTNLEHLHLAFVNIFSPIPDILANLSSLKSLYLTSCGLVGKFPMPIFRLQELQFLELSHNPYLLGHLPEFQGKSHVKGLSLRNTSFSGQLSESIGNLNSLQYLYVDRCKFSGVIPPSLGNLSNLIGLDFGVNSFVGKIPSSIANLTQLTYLSLYDNKFSPGTLSWLEKLAKLIYLNLWNISLHGQIPSLANFTQLEYLNLGQNMLNGQIPSSMANLTQLTHLALCINKFSPGTLSWLEKLTKLIDLCLWNTSLHGQIPSLANFTQLEYLNLGRNMLNGQIPSSLANLTQLKFLSLSFNNYSADTLSWIEGLTNLSYLHLRDSNLHCKIPSFANFTQLVDLDLGLNKLNGTVELDDFLVLKNLRRLYLARIDLRLRVNSRANVVAPMFEALELSSCNLNGFPDFLQFQNQLRYLDLSFNNIKGLIPGWIWNMSTTTLEYLDLSYNLLTKLVQPPDILHWSNLKILNLSSNMLQGSVPVPTSSILFYTISNNSFTGKIPSSICRLTSLHVLDLSNNSLSGMIPQCLSNFSDSLSVLNLQSNHFTGRIPQSWAKTSSLKMISLGQNHLQGLIPRSLANCKLLEKLDLGNNQLNDTFPFWFGRLHQLKILILRSNLLHGMVGRCKSDSRFPKLRILDLSSNDFTGKLPSDCFRCWNAMTVYASDSLVYLQADTSVYTEGGIWQFHYEYSMTMTNKGLKTEYRKIMEIFAAIDLSCNRFEGEIPEVIGKLQGLRLLNLSNNYLSGHIPFSIANLSQLESLDLSQNQLSGQIPEQMTRLTFLGTLNMSCNHLTGPIPRGNQFDTYPESAFHGNPGLCGDQIERKCGKYEATLVPPSAVDKDQDSGLLFGCDWKIVLVGYGSGIVAGVIMGHIVTRRQHGWFMKTFGIRRQSRRRRRKRRA